MIMEAIGMKQNKVLLTGFKKSSSKDLLNKISDYYDKFLFSIFIFSVLIRLTF